MNRMAKMAGALVTAVGVAVLVTPSTNANPLGCRRVWSRRAWCT